jgi:hypothetical protein
MTALATPQKQIQMKPVAGAPMTRKKGEQPGINVATASDEAQGDDRIERNHPGFDQFVAERLVWPCVPSSGRQTKRRKLRKRSEFDRWHENDTPAPPTTTFH